MERGARIGEKVAESGRIEQIDFRLVPLRVGEAGGERMLAADFLFVVVRHCIAFVDLAEAVDHPGIEQQRGHELGFARTAVTHYSHVADTGSVVDLHRWDPPGRSQHPKREAYPTPGSGVQGFRGSIGPWFQPSLAGRMGAAQTRNR